METKVISSTETKSKELFMKKVPTETKVFTALCTNCAERWECTIRNNSSVIWHCEEYK